MAAEVGEDNYTVSIKGNGIAIERSVPAHVAREMIVVIMGGAGSAFPVARQESSRSDNTGRPADDTRTTSGRRTSLREFLDDTEASRNPDKITAIGEYLQRHEGIELFKREDIRARFRSAGEAVPANFHRDFAWAVKNGWIAEDSGSPESFYVTRKGHTAIENKFSDEIKKATAQPVGRRRSRRASVTPSSKDDSE